MGSNVFHRRLDYDYPVATYSEGIFIHGKVFDKETQTWVNKKWIDACGGALVSTIGPFNKETASKVAELHEKFGFVHGTQFTTEHMEEFANKLCNLTPGLNKVFFVSGGSEATESAIKLAKQYWRDFGEKEKFKIIYRRPGYHGATYLATSVTGKLGMRKPQEHLLTRMPWIPAPFCYHCPYDKTYPDCRCKCAKEFEKMINEEGAQSIAAFIAEPIIGASAGAVVPPKEYWPIIREICDKHKILLIFDEVMTGCGRTGKWFAYQHDFGCIPDILTTSKGISGGHAPLAAIFCNDKIYNTIKGDGHGRLEHGFTYENTPHNIGVGNIVLDYVQKNDLVGNCAKMGKYLLAKLQTLSDIDIVGDVRGKGLMTAVEFIKDRETKEPFQSDAGVGIKIVQAAFRRGLNTYFSLGFINNQIGDAVMIAPPYIVTEDEINKIVEIFRESIIEVRDQLKNDKREIFNS